MEKHWALIRCTCGGAYGSPRGTKRPCPHCGSTNGYESKLFETPDQLSEAVASSNLPDGIAQEVESKIAIQKAKADNMATMSRGGPEAIRRILQKSTTSEGIITVELLSRELLKEGYEEPTAEQVIGSAEVEGILIRKAPNLWAWLQ